MQHDMKNHKKNNINGIQNKISYIYKMFIVGSSKR